jgi:hypothetical protein
MYLSNSEFHALLNTRSPQCHQIRFAYHIETVMRHLGVRRQAGKGISRKDSDRVYKMFKDAILERKMFFSAGGENYNYVTKWVRPWEVPGCGANFTAQPGDFGVGIEVEMGFHTREDAQYIANKVRNWRHVTLDYEGGTYPIEATFPPVSYKKFGPRSQAMRYLSLLQREASRVVRHSTRHQVGTHVNVTKGGINAARGGHAHSRVSDVSNMLFHLSSDRKVRYFGRIPYGYGYIQGHGGIEWKLFNSTIDPKVLRTYVNIAVALTDHVLSDDPLCDEAGLIQLLEAAYRKTNRA